MSACITSPYLAGCLSKDVLQLHDFLHKPMEIVAGRARWRRKTQRATFVIIPDNHTGTQIVLKVYFLESWQIQANFPFLKECFSAQRPHSSHPTVSRVLWRLSDAWGHEICKKTILTHKMRVCPPSPSKQLVAETIAQLRWNQARSFHGTRKISRGNEISPPAQ